MVTRADLFKSEEQRRARKKHKHRVSQKKRKKAQWSRKSAHAASKATHAFEDTAGGKRPSRKLTRSSANRAKPDSARNLTEESHKGGPENRARKTIAQRSKVRGG
jgi:hypothetical protein